MLLNRHARLKGLISDTRAWRSVVLKLTVVRRDKNFRQHELLTRRNRFLNISGRASFPRTKLFARGELAVYIYIYLVRPPPRRGIVQELCESRGGRPELAVLTSVLVSVDVKIY